ncbi:MAG: STAS domain-containing protein [Spirochaetes bacterium]|nr:STAS domain-containing protein [Spirochaetota bacterium]
MEITITNPTEELSIVHLKGKFTIEDVHDFKDRTAPLLKGTVKTMLLDMTEMDYIDSSGIGSLILLMNSAKNLSIDLIIYNIHNDILNVFRIAYLDKFFHITTSQELKKAFPGIAL